MLTMGHHFHEGDCKICKGSGLVTVKLEPEPDDECMGLDDTDEEECEDCMGDGVHAWPWRPVAAEDYDPDDFECSRCEARGVELSDYSNDADWEDLICFSCARGQHERLCGCDDPFWRQNDQGVLL